MSLLNILRKKSNFEFFTTPSHGGKFFIFHKLYQFYKYDISETDFHNPQDALLKAEKIASKIYGTTSTHFLTNGSTSGIIAAVLACVKKDEKVLLWDNAHPCHKSAVTLSGAESVFYSLEKNNEWGTYGAVNILHLEKSIAQYNPKALIITSPSYEGFVSDIKKIKEICVKNNVYLIVDEAHGALYPFSENLPDSAISLGADFVIQSLHKTAGGLNPTALLHVNVDESKDKNIDVKSALNLICTTSPSYPLLASIEKNINFLNSKKGRLFIDNLISEIKIMKKNLSSLEFCNNDDETKILVKKQGLSGNQLSEFLYKNGIEDEKTNANSTMLLCGVGTDSKKLKRLEKVLKKLDS